MGNEMRYSQLAVLGMVLCTVSMFLGFIGYTQQVDSEEGLLAFVMTFLMGFLPFSVVYSGIKLRNRFLFYPAAIYGIIALSIDAFLFFDDAEYTALFIGGIIECISIVVLGLILVIEVRSIFVRSDDKTRIYEEA
jgi:hypothetical protein